MSPVEVERAVVMCFIEAFGAVEGVKSEKEEESRVEVAREIDFLTRSKIVRTSPVPVATFFAALSRATLSIKGNNFAGGVELDKGEGVEERASSREIG